jgi:hypothetical protein
MMDDNCPDPDCPLGSKKEAWSLVAEVTAASLAIKKIESAIHGNGRSGMIYDIANLKWKMNLACFLLGAVAIATISLIFGIFSRA